MQYLLIFDSLPCRTCDNLQCTCFKYKKYLFFKKNAGNEKKFVYLRRQSFFPKGRFLPNTLHLGIFYIRVRKMIYGIQLRGIIVMAMPSPLEWTLTTGSGRRFLLPACQKFIPMYNKNERPAQSQNEQSQEMQTRVITNKIPEVW